MRQGLLASLDVFIDTIVVCTLTGLAVLVSGAWSEGTGAEMTVRAFNASMPTTGGTIVAISSLLFGFTSLVGTPYLGEVSFSYLFGTRTKQPFRWLYCLMVLFGASFKVEVAWSIGDLLNGLMTLTNLIGLVGLTGLAVGLVRDYSARLDSTNREDV